MKYILHFTTVVYYTDDYSNVDITLDVSANNLASAIEKGTSIARAIVNGHHAHVDGTIELLSVNNKKN